MNYLSHFYIHQKLNDPYFNSGLILPDLSRGFIKSFKTHEGDFIKPEHNALQAGCMQHYEGDRLFHGSDFFNWGTHICTEEIKQVKFHHKVERSWFIGHIMFEMLLDRLLVAHQPTVLSEFYRQFFLIDTQILSDFFTLNQANQKEKLLQYFNHFRGVQYITNYTNTNLFVYSLSRVLVQAGLPGLTFGDRGLIEDSVVKLEQGEFKEVYSVLLRLKQVF